MNVDLGATLSTAGGVALEHAFGNSLEMALLFWAFPALLGAVAFIPQLFRYERPRGVTTPHVRGLLRDPITWQVTGFLALVVALNLTSPSFGIRLLRIQFDARLFRSNSLPSEMALDEIAIKSLDIGVEAPYDRVATAAAVKPIRSMR